METIPVPHLYRYDTGISIGNKNCPSERINPKIRHGRRYSFLLCAVMQNWQWSHAPARHKNSKVARMRHQITGCNCTVPCSVYLAPGTRRVRPARGYPIDRIIAGHFTVADIASTRRLIRSIDWYEARPTHEASSLEQKKEEILLVVGRTCRTRQCSVFRYIIAST